MRLAMIPTDPGHFGLEITPETRAEGFELGRLCENLSNERLYHVLVHQEEALYIVIPLSMLSRPSVDKNQGEKT